MKNKENLSKQLRSTSNLYDAWAVVRQSGITSDSSEIKTETIAFADHLIPNLNKIVVELRANKFAFDPAKGILKRRPGKSSRPIVLQSVRNKIVQRALLNVLQGHHQLKRFFENPNSFGGVVGRGVPEAIARVRYASSSSLTHYVCSDIVSFFTAIPQDEVVRIVASTMDDSSFISLFKSALDVELGNAAELAENAQMFPSDGIGVAQGSSLSTFAGNILLYDFDTQMNENGISCIRYIDDFIILAPDESSLLAAYKRATAILRQIGLSVYSLDVKDSKAKRGLTTKQFSFLGCDIRPGMVQPTQKKRDKLLKDIDNQIAKSLWSMRNPRGCIADKKSLVDTLSFVSSVIRGWGNQYSFCNCPEVFKQLDEQIESKIDGYLRSYQDRVRRKQRADRRRLMGVWRLEDCNHGLSDNAFLPFEKDATGKM